MFHEDILYFALSKLFRLPFGITAFITIFFLWNILQRNFSDRTLATFECLLILSGTILLTFADRSSRYWSFIFPAFILGSSGNNLLYAHASIAVFKTTPSSQSGVVGAILNSALQLGSAVGTAVTTAIQTNVNEKQSDPVGSYKGRAAVFWFLVGLIGVELVGFWVFFRDTRPLVPDVEETRGSGFLREDATKKAEKPVET